MTVQMIKEDNRKINSIANKSVAMSSAEQTANNDRQLQL